MAHSDRGDRRPGKKSLPAALASISLPYGPHDFPTFVPFEPEQVPVRRRLSVSRVTRTARFQILAHAQQAHLYSLSSSRAVHLRFTPFPWQDSGFELDFSSPDPYTHYLAMGGDPLTINNACLACVVKEPSVPRFGRGGPTPLAISAAGPRTRGADGRENRREDPTPLLPLPV